MSCWIHQELHNEWERMIEQKVGAHSRGYDSPTVGLYWRIIEHEMVCEVCRNDEAVRKMKEVLGTH